MSDIPKNRNYSPSDAQCNSCGGHGCPSCRNRGWVKSSSSFARRCERKGCFKIITPDNIAVYCSNKCAMADA